MVELSVEDFAVVAGNQTENVKGMSQRTVSASLMETVGANECVIVSGIATHTAGCMITEQAPIVGVYGSVIVTICGPTVNIKASGVVNISGNDAVNVTASSVSVKAGTAAVEAKGAMTVSGSNVVVVGGTINLNC